MLVRNLQKVGDYKKSILAQDENLRLAIQNDQNVSDAIKKARAGIKPELTVKQNRIPEQVLTDALEIKTVAMNNLRSIFSEEQAKKFMNGDGRTPPLTQDDMEYLNIFWEDLKPVLQSKTGLTLKFFRDILKKSTAGRRANYGFYTGRTTPAKSLVINTNEELLKTLPPIDMLRAANTKAAKIGQTLPEGASLTKDLSKLVRNFPTGGDKRLLKLDKLPPDRKMAFYKRFQGIFDGYDPDVEKWKKANMKDDMDFVNDIRNLIPDNMTDFETNLQQLYDDMMAEREAIPLEPPPPPSAPSAPPSAPSVAEGKDDLSDPLPDIKGEIIQQDAKETLPTLPAPPKMIEFKSDDDEPEPLEGETTLDALTRRISRQSEDLTTLLEGDDRRKAEERNAELDRLTRQSKADLEEALAVVGGQYEPPEIIEPRLDRSGLNVDEVSWAKALNFLEMERRKQDSVDRAIEQNRQIQAKREEDLRKLAKSIVSLQKKRKATETQDAEVERLQRLQQFEKEQEQELILLQKARMSQMDIDLGQALDRMYDDVSERLSQLDDRLTQQKNAVLAVKVGKARKREEKELRQLEEERAKEEQKLLEVDKRREALLKRLIPLEEAPIELPPKLSRSVAFNPKVGTLKEEQTRLRLRLDELGDPTIRFLMDKKSKRAQKMEDEIYDKVKQDYDKVTKELDDIEDKTYRAETEAKIQENRASADQQLADIRAMSEELIEDKRAKAKALQQWLFSDLVRKPPALSPYRNSRVALRPEQQYPPLYTPSEIRNINNEQGRLESVVRDKDKANEFAIGSLNYLRGKAFNKQNMDNLDKAWVALGKNKTDLELVEFKEVLRQRFNPKEWANEIEDFITAEKDRQAMEELGMDVGEQKRQFEQALQESEVLEDIQRSARQTLDSYSEDQLRILFAQRAANKETIEETAIRLSGETPPPTPPKRRPTPARPRLASRQPSMEVITEEPARPPPVRPNTPLKGRTPTPSKVRPLEPEPELVEPTGVNPLIVEKEQLTEQELIDQLAVLKKKKPRQELDKRARKTEMDAIQNVLGRKAFKETTPIDVLEQRMKSEGTAPKRPLITPRPARTPEQRRQAIEEAKAAEEAAKVRVPTPLRRAPSPTVRLGTPIKARVPVKSKIERMAEQPVDELIAKAEAVLPEVEKLARKRPTPVKARPAEEREGEREMADAQRRRQQSIDAIREQAQKEAELFLAENLRRSGVSRDDIVAVKTMVEQKKKDEGFASPIAMKKAQRSPYRPSENVAKFQSVQAELPETPTRVETLLASRESRVSNEQQRQRLQDEERRARLARELEAQQLKPNEEAKMVLELNRANTPLSRPQTPARTQTPVQRLIQARQLVRDFASMKAELDAGVSDKDAVYAEERERYKNGTKTLNLWNSMNLTPEEQTLLGTSKDEFLGKWADAVRKAGKGIPMKPKTFVEFGKFKLNENMLEEGTLQVKTANGSPVPAFSKKIAISDTLQSILMDLIETKKLRGVSDLDDEERRLLETLIIKAGLAHGLGVKKVHQSDEDAKKVKRFDLVKGIYDAGNNSMEVIHELRSLILYFIKTKRLDRKAGLEALQELQ